MTPQMQIHNRFTSSNEKDSNFLVENVANDYPNDEPENERFYQQQNTLIPWKGIILALVLTTIGLFLSSVFVCSQLGLIKFQPPNPLSFLTVAFITLVPGFYHCMIAFRAYKGYEGYSFEDIANLN